MWRNHAIGCGWRLDTSSAVTMTHNASSVDSIVRNIPGDEVRAGYESEADAVFEADPDRFSSEAERLTWKENRASGVICGHPFLYLYLTLRPVAFLPDIPTLLENQGITRSGNGTLDV